MAFAGCSASDDNSIRFAVQPSTIELSSDRRTVSVEHGNPIEGGCAAKPDGVDVALDDGGRVAHVTVWMRTVELPDGAQCILMCSRIDQSVTVDEPLPDDVELVSIDGARETCWHDPVPVDPHDG